MFQKEQIKSVTVFRPNGAAVYEVGQFLIINEKPSDVRVSNIVLEAADIVAIKFSNGEKIEFFGLPFALSK